MEYEIGEKAIVTSRKHGHGFNIGELIEIVDIVNYRGVFSHYKARSLEKADGLRWAIESNEMKFCIPDGGTNRTYSKLVLDDTY